jgi:hypothetical protein
VPSITADGLEKIAQVTDPLDRAQKLQTFLAEQQKLLLEAFELRSKTIAELGKTEADNAQIRQSLSGLAPGTQPASAAQEPLVERAVPTDPGFRASDSLYLAETDKQGPELGRSMRFVGLEPASAPVARRLRIEPYDPVFARRKLMFADDVPVRIATSYFLPGLAEHTKLEEPDFIAGGLQVVLEGLGLDFGRAAETFFARLPTTHEVALLELDTDIPVVVILRSSYDSSDRPVHTLETVCAANRNLFTTNQLEHDRAF